MKRLAKLIQAIGFLIIWLAMASFVWAVASIGFTESIPPMWIGSVSLVLGFIGVSMVLLSSALE